MVGRFVSLMNVYCRESRMRVRAGRVGTSKEMLCGGLKNVYEQWS